MTLKYKLDDVVVLGENVDAYKSFIPGVKVLISELCSAGTDEEHYTIRQICSKGRWWAYDYEINHNATEELQKSNETRDIVGKIRAVSDDNAEEVQTPVLQENAPQPSNQKPRFVAFFTSVIVAKNKAVSDIGEFLYDENSTKIYLEDEGGGAFLIVEQDYNGAIQQIRLDIDEVDFVFSAANELIMQYKEKTSEC